MPTTDAYGVEIHRQVEDFYRLAGPGAELWIMLVFTDSTTEQIFTAGYVDTLVQAAGGRLAVVAISRFRGHRYPCITMAQGLDADLINGLDEAHAYAQAQATQNRPLRLLLDGRNLAVSPAAVADLRQLNFSRVAINIARTGRVR